MEAISAERPEAENLQHQVRVLMYQLEEKARNKEAEELTTQRMVMVRTKLNLMKVCVILQQVGELYGVSTETAQGFWVPCWFFMAVWPAARKGDQDKAEERAYKVVFDPQYKKAMETKYALSRKIDVDNRRTGMWE